MLLPGVPDCLLGYIYRKPTKYYPPVACPVIIVDLQALKKWEADWLMEFHPDKCSVIKLIRKKTIHRYPYTLHSQILADETKTRYIPGLQ